MLITMGATIFGLFPLAAHGGPLCYAQVGGLSIATFITLLLVPVFDAICVLDLKIVKWETAAADAAIQGERAAVSRSLGTVAAQEG